jgi:hypothetical protein
MLIGPGRFGGGIDTSKILGIQGTRLVLHHGADTILVQRGGANTGAAIGALQRDMSAHS